MTKISTTNFGEINFFPYTAMVPVVETLDWVTDVIDSTWGYEERHKLREYPRQSFAFQFPLTADKRREALNSIYSDIREFWYVPLWTEQQYVGNIAGGQTTVTCNTLMFNFNLNDDGFGMAMLHDGENYQILEYTGKTASSITGVSTDAMAAAYIFPVKKGIIHGKPSDKTNGIESVVSFKFIVDDNLEIEESGALQYKSDDSYYDKIPIIKDSTSRGIIRKQELVDYKIGPFESSTGWVNSRIGSPYNAILDGPIEVMSFRDFAYRRSGKYRQFWSPTFASDMICVSSGLVEDTILVKSDSIIDYAQERDNICVFATDGTYHPRGITGYSQIDSNRVELTLDFNLNLQADDISSISFFGLCRLDSDKITLTWIGNSVAKMSTSIVELSP